MEFFIPDLTGDPEAAERRWEYYLAESPASPGRRRVYSVTYEHDGAKYEITVGERRKRYARRTGPRGGYIKNADYVPWAQETGTVISAIIDGSDVLYAWSYGPPFGGWSNPSVIGRGEVRSIRYFDPPTHG